MGWNYRMSELCAAVALAQLENIEILVEKRIRSAGIFSEAIRGCEWLIPQRTPAGCSHSYWTFAVRLEHPRINWQAFRDRYMELGGDGIYAAWKLTYLEPMFERRSFLGRERFISEDNLKSYRRGLCPVAESVQPKLLQFKTNYWDSDSAGRQADILRRTIASF
jgi:perosamine synthetase